MGPNIVVIDSGENYARFVWDIRQIDGLAIDEYEMANAVIFCSHTPKEFETTFIDYLTSIDCYLDLHDDQATAFLKGYRRFAYSVLSKVFTVFGQPGQVDEIPYYVERILLDNSIVLKRL